ncbi:uncharacterized protein [Epargyreus clarus]|uniref:uncharacterized protein n=1 Tax=Epargyreus clarus TaxID=520877 RepID=UPI003C2C73F9
MDSSMDKSFTDAESPPTYVSQRAKKPREDTQDSLTIQLNDFKKEIKEMMSLFSSKQEKELQHVSNTLKIIQQSNLNIENSIAYLTSQNEEFKKKINLLESQAREDKKYITILENKIEDLQVGCRKSNIQIKNVPKMKNETKEELIEMVMCLSQTLECKIDRSDIKDIYRVRGRKPQEQNSPIVVETSSALLKSEILKKGKAFNIKHKSKICSKHLGFKKQTDVPVFLSEHLTVKGSRLHFLARDLAKTRSYKFCWTAYGKVYVRKDESSPIITIRTEEQVQKLQLEK